MNTLLVNRQPKAPVSDDDARWAAVNSRDRSADGAFFYSVRTTGVYCRPSCPSRLPRRENVSFHPNREAAEQAGFRPCKRCRPDQLTLEQQRAAIVAAACRRIEEAEGLPTLEALAKSAGMSPFHFHRIFKAATGMTPRAYAAGRRAHKVRKHLAQGEPVTNAIYDAGFGSSSRFYAKSTEMLGMRPADYRAGGARTDIRFAIGECSLGSILVAATERGLCAILLGSDPDALLAELHERFPQAHFVGGDESFERWVAQVVGLVEVPRIGLELPLDIRGTAFQQRVWQALREIPPGSTATYSDIAERIGSPRAVRAVAQACAANPLAVAIPCHRVVRIGGALSGYRWGVERKRALLERERIPRDDESELPQGQEGRE